MLRSLFAAISLLTSHPANPHTNPQWQFAVADTSEPAATETGIDPSLHPEVVQVRCLTGMGSAFWIGSDIILSVKHVTSLGGCFINGAPIKVVETSGDFSVLSSDTKTDKWLTVDCDGFKAGHSYIAIGYARGLPVQTTVDIVDTGQILSGFARLWGVFTVIPGQSGGPIIDASTGKVVGTVNVYNSQTGDSGSIELKGTSICKGKTA